MTREEAYRSCFLAALTGLCGNPAILPESEMELSTGRRPSRQLMTIMDHADRVAKSAAGFIQAKEACEMSEYVQQT
jgi:hypothetical protein